MMNERQLLEWLSKEDASAFGECRGPTLGSLIAKGLAQVEWHTAMHEDYGRVSLTEAGWAQLSNEETDTPPKTDLIERLEDAANWAISENDHFNPELGLEAAQALAAKDAEIAELREAALNVLQNVFSTYKARNGRDVGIEADDGEKCFIIHSEYIFALRGALEEQNSSPDRNEVAYLIEMKGPSGEPVYYGKTETGLDWTADANAAVRYARREDAQAVIDDIGWTEPSPVEHMWVEPSARKALGGSD